jgi:hypothetical protein
MLLSCNNKEAEERTGVMANPYSIVSKEKNEMLALVRGRSSPYSILEAVSSPAGQRLL